MKKSFLTILPMALLASCSSELVETTGIATKGNVEKVSIQSHPFEFEDGTRTSLSATEKAISFAWANTDALGVFPISPTTNNQAKQDIKLPADCEVDAHYASFDGAGWDLIANNTYAAYCPYDGTLPAETPYTAVPISLTGQDGTLATIGQKYDFMYAPSSFAEENTGTHTHEVVFDFQHAIAVIQFKLTMPVAATWKSIVITNDAGDKVWTTSATMNVATGAVTSTATASSISLALSGVTTTAEGQEVVLYASVLPTTTGALTLTATTSADEEYTASLASKTLVAGKAYRYTVSELQAKPTYEAVDLGLSVKWANMNVGAQSETDYGDYFAWGETEPKSTYSWSTYKWSVNGSSSSFSKYTTDSKTTLDLEDDAARQNMGGTWRMPTPAELEELINNCSWQWVTSYNNVSVNGYVVTGSNGNSIFLPAAGYVSSFWGDIVSNAGSFGYYWSSSLSDSNSGYARYLPIGQNNSYLLMNMSRDTGYSVRAVCE
ncbi:MAG: fimbrillin family protein [Bacteroidaceae bacterium]|nr:fimbrillin family protein [Bacteroidaceae bacterium]